MSTNDYERYQTELEFASILGMPFMGTGNDPTSANNRNIEYRTVAGEKWEALNVLSLQWGIHLYPHNHSPAYNFLQDGPMVTVTEDRVTGAPIAPTLVRGVRQAPHAALHRRHRPGSLPPRAGHLLGPRRPAPVAWRYDWDGNRVEDIFDPLDQVARQTMRYALFHAKDGDRTAQPPGVENATTSSRSATPGATSTSRRSSRTWAPWAITTRTTSRTTRPAVALIPDSRCAMPRSVPTTCWRCEG